MCCLYKLSGKLWSISTDKVSATNFSTNTQDWHMLVARLHPCQVNQPFESPLAFSLMTLTGVDVFQRHSQSMHAHNVCCWPLWIKCEKLVSSSCKDKLGFKLLFSFVSLCNYNTVHNIGLLHLASKWQFGIACFVFFTFLF